MNNHRSLSSKQIEIAYANFTNVLKNSAFEFEADQANFEFSLM